MTQSASDNKVASSNFWLKTITTDAVLLAVISAISYAYVYIYETGYASHFGYPDILISPSLSIIIPVLVGLAAFAAVLTPIFIGNDGLPRFNFRRFAVLMLVLNSATACFAIVRDNFTMGSDTIVALSVAAGIVVLLFIPGLGPMLRRAEVPPIIMLALAYPFTAAVVEGVGTIKARAQSSFYFLEAQPNYALVRVFGETGVAAQYDFENNQFTGAYAVFKIGDDPKFLGLKRILVSTARPAKQSDKKK